MKKSIAFLLAAAAFLSGCTSNSNIEESEVSVKEETTALSEETTPSVTSISYEIDPEKPLVALTFDDGPNNTTTVQVLNILEKYQVPASFFVVGNNITPATEEVVKKAYDMGCEINNHSKTHSYMNKMTAEDIREEVIFVSDKVKEITGEPTKFFRPPFIAVNSDMYDNIDMPFICGLGCNDWDNKVTVQERVDNTLKQIQDGAIILLHDSAGNTQTVEAIDKIIPELLDQGYQLVTVSELFEIKEQEIQPDDNNLYSIVQ